MGKEIASLYATLGLNTSNFQKGLSGVKGNLGSFGASFRSIADEVTGGQFSRISGKFEQLTGISGKMAIGFGVAGSAIALAGKFAAESMEHFTKLAQSTEDLSRITGDSAENTSKLIDVAGDLRITYESLYNAMKIANKNGFNTNIESLKRMADEYTRIQDPVKKTQYLVERFGRSGEEVGRLFENGSKGIDTMTNSVLKANIVTEKQIEDAKKLLEVQNDLEDVQDAVKNSVGRVAMEGWTQVLLGIKVLFYGFTKEVDDSSDSLAVHKGFVEDDAESLITLRNAQNDVNIAAQDSTQYFKDLTLEMIYNKAAAILDAEGALILGRNLGLVDENTYNTMTAIGLLTDKYDTNKDGVIDLKEKTNDYLRELYGIYGVQQLLQDKTVTYKINILTTGSLNNQDILPLTANQGSGEDSGGTGTLEYPGKPYNSVTNRRWHPENGGYWAAAGADFIVPPGFSNDSFRLNTTSGERVKVEPASKVMETGKQAGIDYDKMASTLVYALKRAGAFA